jgi:hypothetical protein
MMVNTRELVARLYLGISMVLGIPSGIVFLFTAWDAVRIHMLMPAKSSPSSPTGNLIVDGLVAGASLIGKAFWFAGAVGEWVLRAVALAAFLIAAVAAVLFVIGRGLHAGRTWARVLGILVALGPLFCSYLVMTSSRRPLPMSLGAMGMAAAGYVVWVLGWRFV